MHRTTITAAYRKVVSGQRSGRSLLHLFVFFALFFQLTDNIKSVQLDDAKLSLYVLLKDGQYFRVASNHMGDQRYKFNRDVKRFSKAMIAIMENDLDAFIDGLEINFFDEIFR